MIGKISEGELVLMAKKLNPLQKQLEQQKFLHALDYVRRESNGIKKLTTSELSRINQFITGNDEEPWRFNSVHIELPNGQIQEMNVITNPINRARDILSSSFDLAANDQIQLAAIELYTHLVLEHLFLSGNRRTAVLAVAWLLSCHNLNIDAEVLLKVPVGNLRNETEKESFKEALLRLISQS